eukprot:259441-Pyramimonas_sp.AAC.1
MAGNVHIAGLAVIAREIGTVGGVGPLVKLLDHPDPYIMVHAVKTLCRLTALDPPSAQQAAKAQCVPALVSIATDRRRAEEAPVFALVASDAIVTLRHVAQVGASHLDMQANGGVDAAVRVLSEATNIEVAINTTGVLYHLAKCGQAVLLNDVCKDERALDNLLRILTDSRKVGKVEAAGLVGLLAQDSVNRMVLVEAGALPPIVRLLLRGNTPNVRATAAAAAASLASAASTADLLYHAEFHPPLVRSPVVQQLVRMERDKGALGQMEANQALGALARAGIDCQLAVAEARGPAQLMELLARGLPVQSRSAAAVAVHSQCCSGKLLPDQLIAAGGVRPLLELLRNIWESTTEAGAGSAAAVLAF